MRWLDVFGPHGVGKSTTCGMLPKNPVLQPAPPPDEWEQFLACAWWLLDISRGPRAEKRKRLMSLITGEMAGVHAMEDPGCYFIHGGFAQQGMAMSYNLEEPWLMARYFELMPVSAGCVVMSADLNTIKYRNRTRTGRDYGQFAERAMKACDLARGILHRRKVPILEIDATEPPDVNAGRINAFAMG